MEREEKRTVKRILNIKPINRRTSYQLQMVIARPRRERRTASRDGRRKREGGDLATPRQPALHSDRWVGEGIRERERASVVGTTRVSVRVGGTPMRTR